MNHTRIENTDGIGTRKGHLPFAEPPSIGCKTSGNISNLKGIARILLFFLILGLLAVVLDQLIKRGTRSIKTSGIGAFNKVMTGAVNAQIVISGSSRALVQYNPEIIHRITGKSAYNIGRNGSHIDMQFGVLRAYLKHNVKPELIIQNLDLHSFVPTKELYDPAQYLPFLDEDELYMAIRRIHPDAWKWKYIPLYGYLVEDLRFTWLRGLQGAFGINPREDHILGFNPRDLQWTGEFERFKSQSHGGYNVEMELAGITVLTELLELCAKEAIEIILVYSPEYHEAQDMTLNRTEIFQKFNTLASRFQLTIWDYSDSPLCKERKFFYNSQHLNRIGAEAFSRDIATKLNSPNHAL